MDCPLCLDTCKVPVEITGFPCHRPEEIHCHTMIRYCRTCCTKLFELDKPRHERKEYLKCLYCDSSLNPRELSATPFRTDHFLIRQDANRDLGCPRCDHVAVDHQALEKHCAHECEETDRLVCGCGTHHSKRSNHACALCTLCDRCVSTDTYSQHLVEYHEMEVCNQCDKMTHLPMEEHRETECLCRLLPCRYCPETVQALHFTDHLLGHMEESKQRCELLHDLMKKERILSNRLLNECREFFDREYQESLI